MAWLEAIVEFDGLRWFSSGNYHVRWFLMVIHYQSNDTMVTYHRSIGAADKDTSANTKTNLQIKVQIQKQISGVPGPEEQ